MSKTLNTTVINLFAGPGAGKSTTAAGLFHLMKRDGYSVELTTEYAKDMVWEERHNVFPDQVYIFAKQHRKIHRLIGKVRYVITDSPLLLSNIYFPEDYPKSFHKFVEEMFSKYDNRNFFIERLKEYVKVGRNQSESEAREIDSRVKRYLNGMGTKFKSIPGDRDAALKIYKEIVVNHN